MNNGRFSSTPRRRPLAACIALAFAVGTAHVFAHADVGSIPPAARAERAAWTHTVRSPSAGTGIVVDNCNDDGPGSLRQAYRNASTDDTIDLTQLTCSTITLTSGALEDSPTASDISLSGPGKYYLTIDGGNADRVIVHNGSGALSISGMTIKNGSYSGPDGGGCIRSEEDVALFQAAVLRCSVSTTGADDAVGGAVSAQGEVMTAASQILYSSAQAEAGDAAGGGIWANSVKIQVSTITGNTVASDGVHYARGGGVFSATDAEIVYSTISGNEAANGGGIFLVGAANYTMYVRTSTISGNHASESGGGVYAKYRPFAVFSSTITGNTAGDQAGGLFLAYATELESSIIAGNTAQDAATADIGSPYTLGIVGANNLVLASNQVLPPDTLSVDPMLGPLQDNGGLSMTHALLPGSPAIDHGNGADGSLFDQRLFEPVGGAIYERPVGPAPDIGAFEFGAPDRILTDGFDG